MAVRLTKTLIDGLVCTKTGRNDSDIFFDSKVSGLAIRIYPSGKKVFLIDYRSRNRQRRMNIGDARILTVDQARKLARTKLSEVLSGEDPLQKKIECKKAVTIEQLCGLYLEYAQAHKRSWRQDWNRFRGRIIPAWGRMKARSLARKDVASLHESIGADHPTEANLVVKLVSSMYSWGERQGYLPEGHLNPCKGIRYFPSHRRDRWIQGEEMARLIESVDAEEDIYVRAAIMLLILTGCRKSEILNARWEDVNIERKELRLPETKSGCAQMVPLSAPAIEILQGLPRMAGNPHVIPGERPGAHRVNVSKNWDRIRERAGLPDLHLHDLRRSYGSILASDGVPLQIIQRLLRHSSIHVTQAHYGHLARDVVQGTAESLGGKVVEFRRIKKRESTEKQVG